MKLTKIFAVVCSVMLLAACARTGFHLQERDDSAQATINKPQHYFVSGIGQRKDIDPVAICGGLDKVMKVETQWTFVNGLVSFFTFGIYTPIQARVYCSG